jgi:deoxyribose-phosphate aldolase
MPLTQTDIPQLASMIDHTLLKPEATTAQVEQLCDEARRFGFASVCVNPTRVKLCARLLQGSPVRVCTVVGFPLGANLPEIKAFETEQAIRDGATEIDMVINIGALKDKDTHLVARDIAAVVGAAHAAGALVKVIIEAALLTDEDKVTACRLAKDAKADYVKTSTGLGPGGATEHDVALMRQTVGPEMGVKAAGGIRTLQDAQRMIVAGATRLGASASVKIMAEAGAT